MMETPCRPGKEVGKMFEGDPDWDEYLLEITSVKVLNALKSNDEIEKGPGIAGEML